MIIKALLYSAHDFGEDNRFIANAQIYTVKRIYYKSAEQRDQIIFSAYNSIYAPFGLAADKITEVTRENVEGQCMVIQIIEPRSETSVIVLENCAVFIENDEGRTIDTHQVKPHITDEQLKPMQLEPTKAKAEV